MSIRVGLRPMGGGRSSVYRPAVYDAFRRSHEIEGATVEQTDYQVKVKALYDYSFPDGRFYDLSDEWVAIVGDPNTTHYLFPAHKSNFVEVNKVVDGANRKYLAYDCGIAATEGTLRLYYADVLDGAWTPYSGNPILGPDPVHYRKPSVAYDAGTFHAIIADRTDEKLERWTSADGITFGFVEFITVPVETKWMAPFIWFNPNDNRWYLYHNEWNAVDANCKFYVRNAATIAGLSAAVCSEVTGPPGYRTVAGVMYRDGLYWLVLEDYVVDHWETTAYWGNSPGSFTECDDSPILNVACAQIGLSPDGSKAYIFYNINPTGVEWYQRAREIHVSSLRPYEVNLATNCNSDFGGIRFTEDDGETELDYWMESKTDDDNAVFWVEIPTIPADPGTVTIYMYYGRADAITTSDGDETFPLFDHFLGVAVDGGKWDTVTAVGGTVGVAGSILTCSVPDGVADLPQANVRSKAPYLYGDNYALRARATYPTGARRNAFIGFSNHDDVGNYPIIESSEQGMLVAWADPSKFVRTANLDVLTNTAITFTVDAYAVFEARRTAANFVGLEEDAQTKENTTNLPSGSISIVLGIESPNNSSAVSMLIDWALIRKYVDPEPARGDWGAEEGVVWPF